MYNVIKAEVRSKELNNKDALLAHSQLTELLHALFGQCCVAVHHAFGKCLVFSDILNIAAANCTDLNLSPR